ncbi:MAG TPA: ATP synthase F1 subunit delta [Gemmataceae bacterium]|nr:ATP synthase F1 subunit delta [Gemmataceae bacterium]
MPMSQSFLEQVRTPGALSPEELARVQGLYENILLEADSHTSMGRIPRTYAEAILAVATARKQVVEVATDYRDFIYDILPNVPGLEAYLDSPAVSRKQKDAFIFKLLDGKASELFIDFLRVLNHKQRLGMLRFIGIAFRTLLEEQMNRQRVLVETATPLADEQKAAIKQTLAETIGKHPVLVVRVRPELIGGLLIHLGDKVFDTSVRSKLRTLRNKLLARGTHEIQSRRDRFRHS